MSIAGKLSLGSDEYAARPAPSSRTMTVSTTRGIRRMRSIKSSMVSARCYGFCCDIGSFDDLAVGDVFLANGNHVDRHWQSEHPHAFARVAGNLDRHEFDRLALDRADAEYAVIIEGQD